MSKISKVVKTENWIKKNKPVVNFMGGISYKLNPLDTLKMISASSIFGEPQYYRESGVRDGKYKNPRIDLISDSLVFDIPQGASASEVMISTIWEALDYDFEGVLGWAMELRADYNMRLNPQIIMVLAAIHPKRKEFTKEHKGVFSDINYSVMHRADEPATQLAFYLYYNKDKSKLPSILKRSWAQKLQNLTRYEIAKYKNHEVGMINTIRLCHANSPLIDELMQNGNVAIDDKEKTWENLKSEGKTWKEILDITYIPHMALLRNLRNIFTELTSEDKELAKKVLETLKSGVLKGKQFPFRYYQAYKIIYGAEEISFKSDILDTLEECIDISLANMPKLKGKTACLSDNSGSAWGTLTSEYGTMQLAKINNLSAVLTCMNSEDGVVYKFGDRLKEYPITKRDGALSQADKISSELGYDVGLSTEHGIWLFFKEAIEKNIFYDNIFIYSDMQAGHAGLFGKGRDYVVDSTDFAFAQNYIDVNKLIKYYRNKVNPKVNVFCVQTAGYNNILIPEYIYRGAYLYGWTGKESLFASKLIEQWDIMEVKNDSNK